MARRRRNAGGRPRPGALTTTTPTRKAFRPARTWHRSSRGTPRTTAPAAGASSATPGPGRR
eukprot:10674829-Lingulodinium_polyedra.AAC.1